MVKNPPASAGDAGDTASTSGSEDPLEEGVAAHSSIHDWRIPWTEELGWPRSLGLQRVRHDLAHHTHNTATANISCLHIGRLIHGAVFLCTEDTHVSVVVFFSPSVQFSHSVVSDSVTP